MLVPVLLVLFLQLLFLLQSALFSFGWPTFPLFRAADVIQPKLKGKYPVSYVFTLLTTPHEGLFRDREQLHTEYNKVRKPNWRVEDQLAIYKCG